MARAKTSSSIVFAIIATLDPAVITHDIFHLVFFIVLFSILVQGTFLPRFATALGMTDNSEDVMKTFTDYTADHPVRFIRFEMKKGHPWGGQLIKDIVLPPETLIVLIIRDGKKLIPNGKLHILSGDDIILAGRAIGHLEGVSLYEKLLEPDDPWVDKQVYQLRLGRDLIVMIRRGERIIIPKGTTKLRDGDVLVINDSEYMAPEWETSDNEIADLTSDEI